MVGGGAGGFELALTMHARLTKDRLAGRELRSQRLLNCNFLLLNCEKFS